MKHYKYIIYLFLALLCTIQGNAQNYKRSIIYTTYTEYLFSLPEKTDPNLISDYDWANITKEPKWETTEFLVDEYNYPIIISTKHKSPEYEGDYQHYVQRCITDQNGTKMYNHQGEEIIAEGEIDPISFDPIEDAIIDELGHWNRFFQTPYEETITLLTNAGFTTSYDMTINTLTAKYDEIEIIINYSKNSIETRNITNHEITRSKIQFFHVVDDYIIPKSEISISYITIENIRVQNIEIKEYTQYQILDEENNVIVSYEQTEKIENSKGFIVSEYEEPHESQFWMNIYPNPAHDILTLDFTNNSQSEKIQVEIVDMQGTAVLQKRLTNGQKHKIALNGIPAGNYIITCKSSNKIKSEKVIIY